jgi:hypothetical protein
VDGFVAHVVSFRKIKVFDMRIIIAALPGVVFIQADFMRPVSSQTTAKGGYCE